MSLTSSGKRELQNRIRDEYADRVDDLKSFDSVYQRFSLGLQTPSAGGYEGAGGKFLVNRQELLSMNKALVLLLYSHWEGFIRSLTSTFIRSRSEYCWERQSDRNLFVCALVRDCVIVGDFELDDVTKSKIRKKFRNKRNRSLVSYASTLSQSNPDFAAKLKGTIVVNPEKLADEVDRSLQNMTYIQMLNTLSLIHEKREYYEAESIILKARAQAGVRRNVSRPNLLVDLLGNEIDDYLMARSKELHLMGNEKVNPVAASTSNLGCFTEFGAYIIEYLVLFRHKFAHGEKFYPGLDAEIDQLINNFENIVRLLFHCVLDAMADVKESFIGFVREL